MIYAAMGRSDCGYKLVGTITVMSSSYEGVLAGKVFRLHASK